MRYLLILLFLTACSLQESGVKQELPVGKLTLIAEYEMDVPEPSGLSLSANGKFLWTVSDQTGLVYAVSFEGKKLRELTYHGEDPEGIVQNSSDQTLWVVEEQRRELVHLDTLGNESERFVVDVENRSANSGLEGIALDVSGNTIYLLNEKDPALFLKLDQNMLVQNAILVNFAEDCSGLTFDAQQRCLWMLSDASKTLIKMDTTGVPLIKYALPWDKAEGIAVDNRSNVVYMVNDSRSMLSLFELPQE